MTAEQVYRSDQIIESMSINTIFLTGATYFALPFRSKRLRAGDSRVENRNRKRTLMLHAFHRRWNSTSLENFLERGSKICAHPQHMASVIGMIPLDEARAIKLRSYSLLIFLSGASELINTHLELISTEISPPVRIAHHSHTAASFCLVYQVYQVGAAPSLFSRKRFLFIRLRL